MEKMNHETAVHNESFGDKSAIDQRALAADRTDEEGLTFRYVARHHPALVWWSFFYAMSAVGWYVRKRLLEATIILTWAGDSMLKSTVR